MQTISTEVKDLIRADQRIIGRLMALFNKSSFTIIRWIEDRDPRLTTPGALHIISEVTGLSDEQILDEVAA